MVETDLLGQAAQWQSEGRRVAIATVISTWGSAPQPVGSQLIVDQEGNFEGSVSGGCVEGEVITAAQDVIANGGFRVLEFGVADETAWRVGLACGGRIRIAVEPLNA
jgi:xanthine/CO dehydrogenase XdhC/CoxF family maturation factor